MGIMIEVVKWVMMCVSTVSYKYMVNGKLTEVMKAKRGIRQGDPVSLYLFALILEYMNRVQFSFAM